MKAVAKKWFYIHHIEILDVEHELDIIHIAEREFSNYKIIKKIKKSCNGLSENVEKLHKLIVND